MKYSVEINKIGDNNYSTIRTFEADELTAEEIKSIVLEYASPNDDEEFTLWRFVDYNCEFIASSEDYSKYTVYNQDTKEEIASFNTLEEAKSEAEKIDESAEETITDIRKEFDY